MIISFIGIWCVRVPIALVCGKLLHLDVTFIWMAIALDQIVRILINMTVFHKKEGAGSGGRRPGGQSRKLRHSACTAESDDKRHGPGHAFCCKPGSGEQGRQIPFCQPEGLLEADRRVRAGGQRLGLGEIELDGVEHLPAEQLLKYLDRIGCAEAVPAR